MFFFAPPRLCARLFSACGYETCGALPSLHTCCKPSDDRNANSEQTGNRKLSSGDAGIVMLKPTGLQASEAKITAQDGDSHLSVQDEENEPNRPVASRRRSRAEERIGQQRSQTRGS